MNDVRRFCLILAPLLLSLISTESRADEWDRIVGERELRGFVSGAAAEITINRGVIATGEYYSD